MHLHVQVADLFSIFSSMSIVIAAAVTEGLGTVQSNDSNQSQMRPVIYIAGHSHLSLNTN